MPEGITVAPVGRLEPAEGIPSSVSALADHLEAIADNLLVNQDPTEAKGLIQRAIPTCARLDAESAKFLEDTVIHTHWSQTALAIGGRQAAANRLIGVVDAARIEGPARDAQSPNVLIQNQSVAHAAAMATVTLDVAIDNVRANSAHLPHEVRAEIEELISATTAKESPPSLHERLVKLLPQVKDATALANDLLRLVLAATGLGAGP